MKRCLLLIIPLLLIAGYYYYNFISRDALTGTYLNTNFERSVLAEIPSVADTLIIYPNNTFISGFYGKGTYQLSKNIAGTTIDFAYGYQFGKAALEAPVERSWLGTPRIILARDIEQYYEKVEE